MFLGAGHQENDGFVGTPRQTGGRLQPPHFLRAGRRLEPGDGEPDPKLRDV